MFPLVLALLLVGARSLGDPSVAHADQREAPPAFDPHRIDEPVWTEEEKADRRSEGVEDSIERHRGKGEHLSPEQRGTTATTEAWVRGTTTSTPGIISSIRCLSRTWPSAILHKRTHWMRDEHHAEWVGYQAEDVGDIPIPIGVRFPLYLWTEGPPVYLSRKLLCASLPGRPKAILDVKATVVPKPKPIHIIQQTNHSRQIKPQEKNQEGLWLEPYAQRLLNTLSDNETTVRVPLGQAHILYAHADHTSILREGTHPTVTLREDSLDWQQALARDIQRAQSEVPTEDHGWVTRTERSADGAPVAEEFKRADRAFTAYDCTKPGDVKIVQTREAAACPTRNEIIAQKEVEYLVLQKAKYRRTLVTRCSMRTSIIPAYCGTADHQTIFTGRLLLDQENHPDVATCKEWWKKGRKLRTYTDKTGRKTFYQDRLVFNATMQLSYEHVGTAWHDGSQVECEGGMWLYRDPRTDEVHKYSGMTVWKQDIVDLYEEEAQIDENGRITVASAGLQVSLPCTVGERECQTTRGTYYWQDLSSTEQCRYYRVRESKGILVATDTKKQVFISQDGSLIRLEKIAPASACGSVIFTTNYEELYLVPKATASTDFLRDLPLAEHSTYTYVNQQDGVLYGKLTDYIQKEISAVLQADCLHQAQRRRHDFAARAAEDQAVVDGGTTHLGGGNFATAAGEVWYTYTCRPTTVIARATPGRCYESLPVTLSHKDQAALFDFYDEERKKKAQEPGVNLEQNSTHLQFFLEPKTRQLTTFGIERPCIEEFAPQYQSNQGYWWRITDQARPTREPETVETRVGQNYTVSKPEEVDVEKGGIYTKEKLREIEQYLQAPRIRKEMSAALARQFNRPAEGTPVDVSNLFPNFPHLGWGKPWSFSTFFWDFVDRWGKVSSIILLVFFAGRALTWITGLIIRCLTPAPDTSWWRHIFSVCMPSCYNYLWARLLGKDDSESDSDDGSPAPRRRRRRRRGRTGSRRAAPPPPNPSMSSGGRPRAVRSAPPPPAPPVPPTAPVETPPESSSTATRPAGPYAGLLPSPLTSAVSRLSTWAQNRLRRTPERVEPTPAIGRPWDSPTPRSSFAALLREEEVLPEQREQLIPLLEFRGRTQSADLPRHSLASRQIRGQTIRRKSGDVHPMEAEIELASFQNLTASRSRSAELLQEYENVDEQLRRAELHQKMWEEEHADAWYLSRRGPGKKMVLHPVSAHMPTRSPILKKIMQPTVHDSPPQAGLMTSTPIPSSSSGSSTPPPVMMPLRHLQPAQEGDANIWIRPRLPIRTTKEGTLSDAATVPHQPPDLPTPTTALVHAGEAFKGLLPSTSAAPPASAPVHRRVHFKPPPLAKKPVLAHPDIVAIADQKPDSTGE